MERAELKIWIRRLESAAKSLATFKQVTADIVGDLNVCISKLEALK